MELLIIEPCRYTRQGISLLLKKEKNIKINYIENIRELIPHQTDKNADLILANLSPYLRHASPNLILQEFFHRSPRSPCFIYTHADYPHTKTPLHLQRGTYLINKKTITALLQHLCSHTLQPPRPATRLTEQMYGTLPLLTPREIMVMHSWMQQLPTHRIALRLHLSPRTVYAHKHRLLRKLRVKNHIELCYLYQLIRHVYSI